MCAQIEKGPNQRRFFMKRHPFITIISIIGLLVLLWPANVWAQGPTIRFVPSTTTPKVGDMVNVDIRVENVSNLYGAEVHVAFDHTRLEVLDDDPAQTGVQILPGSFFPKSDPSYVAVNRADNAAGTIDYAITLLAPESPLNGSGTLATIRFAANTEGTAALTFASTQLADMNGASISHSTANSSLSISQGVPGAGKDCIELIRNGGFEETAYWQMPATPRSGRYTTVDKYSGSRSVLLGIQPGEADVYSFSSAYQKIHVPANATSVTLSFWARRFTQEIPKAVVDPTLDQYDPAEVIEGTYDYSSKSTRLQYDWQEVFILQYPCYNWMATLMRARSNDGAWTQYTYDLSAFAGQDIVVYFDAVNNGNGLRTWMFVDEVTVQACFDVSPCAELVRNRSFEWTSDWTTPATPRTAGYSTAAAYTGARSMRNGVVPPTIDTYSHSSAYQAIDIPAGASSPTLTFWYKPYSEEAPRSDWKAYDWVGYDPAAVIRGDPVSAKALEIDWQEMLILDRYYHLLPGGVVLRRVQNDGQWHKVTYDLSPYKGMRINLYFNTINDGDGQRTWMYVDDVSVNLCGYVVRFDPSSTQVGVGQTFDVNLRVENVANLYAFATKIRFNPAILEVVDADGGTAGVQVSVGSMFPSDPAKTHVVQNTADNGAGEIDFALTLLGSTPALNGSGTVATIRFHAKAAGTTPLAFSSLQLVDPSATPFPATHADGQVTVTSGTSQATLTGKVLLEGRTNHSGTQVQVAGGPSTTTAADGSYTVVVSAGVRTLTFSHPSYLTKSVSATAVAGSTVTVAQQTLLAGDINGDGKVDILDLVALGAQFGSTSPSPATVDINGDGVVDIIDIVLVATNF
jgi:hypothetical protein